MWTSFCINQNMQGQCCINKQVLSLPVISEKFLSHPLTCSSWIGLATCSASPNTRFGFMEQPPSEEMSVSIAKGKEEAWTGATLAVKCSGKEVTQMPFFTHKSLVRTCHLSTRTQGSRSAIP